MKAKLIVNNQEIEIEISEEEYKKLQTTEKKETGYERLTYLESYYYVNAKGLIESSLEGDDIADDRYYEVANYYHARSVAENNARADKLMRQLRRFAVEHREGEIDWNYLSTSKYCIAYDYEDKKIIIDSMDVFRYFGNVVFNSEQTARLAIDAFYNELIWYFTEYKDSL